VKPRRLTVSMRREAMVLLDDLSNGGSLQAGIGDDRLTRTAAVP
jgi:hypothetical protein